MGKGQNNTTTGQQLTPQRWSKGQQEYALKD